MLSTAEEGPEGGEHQATLGLVQRVVVIGDSARTDLDTLSGDWASTAEACWPHHSKRVSTLLESGARRRAPAPFSNCPGGLLGAIATTAFPTAPLDEISSRVWNGEEVAEELLALADNLDAFADAIAGSFHGPKGLRRIYERGPRREKAILFMDLAGSFVHAMEHSPEENRVWKKLAVGCAAQWEQAVGGNEPRDREGEPHGKARPEAGPTACR